MRWLKHILPQSLYGRFLLIVLLPMLLAQCFLAYIFYERHWQSMDRNLSASLAHELTYLHDLLLRDLGAFRKAATKLHIGGKVNMGTIDENNTNKYQKLRKLLQETWQEDAFSFQYDSGKEQLEIQVQAGNNVASYHIPRKRLSSSTTTIFILWMAGISLLLSIISLLFLKNQVKSILHLTKAAQAFGRGAETGHYKPHGAKEVRGAGLAFIQMQERIKRLLTRRTEMLANVSHDLKTPLARMRLELEMLPDHEKKDSLREDVLEMEQMVNEYLTFTKDTQAEAVEAIALQPLLEQLTRRQSDLSIALNCPDITLEGRPLGLKRALQNIISNAAKHATILHITAAMRSNAISIVMEDDGPGIPEHEREHVFQPFVKLDSARSNQKGSVGLGLTIARDIINAHGGRIQLLRSPKLDGLRVEITLPV